MATLEDVLVPLYMGHRYQVEAVAKLVGGEDYTFSLRGKGDRNPQIIAAGRTEARTQCGGWIL
jgi:hypothetical protein